MADYRAIVGVSAPPAVFRSTGRTAPDFGPDKTGGTGDKFGFGKTGLALRGDSERRDQRRGRSLRISDLAITALAVIWLQKQPGAAAGELFAKGQSGNATGPIRGSTNRATWAAEPLLRQVRRD
jgi:hypothetical protein